MEEKNESYTFVEDYEGQSEFNSFEELFLALKEYLKTKLTPVLGKDGVVYWDCGLDHNDPYLQWEYYRNINQFCREKNIGEDFEMIICMINMHLGWDLKCECELLNNDEIKEK